MNDDAKTKEQLLAEIKRLRSKIEVYKAAEITYKQKEERLVHLESAFEMEFTTDLLMNASILTTKGNRSRKSISARTCSLKYGARNALNGTGP